jgi:hypothetical protein
MWGFGFDALRGVAVYCVLWLLDGIVTGFCNIRVVWIPSVRADGGSVPYMWVDLFGLVM